MRRRTIIVAVIALLLLGGTVQARSGGDGRPGCYTVEPGAASGTGYHLSTLSWQVSGPASGGGYRLLGPAAPSLRGSGCCCTYLPLALRKVP